MATTGLFDTLARSVGRATGVELPGLSRWRVHRAMLQQQLADASGVSRTTITRLESGGRCGLDTVARLAAALRCEPSDLMGTPPPATSC